MMNSQKLFYLLFFIGLVACDFDDKVPESPFYRLSLNEVSQVNQDGATFEADIVVIGNNDIAEYGFIWNRNNNLILDNSFSIAAGNLANGSFSETVETDLINDSTYYVRAYLKAGDLTFYSETQTFIAQGNRLASNYVASSLTGVWGDTIQIVGDKFSEGIDNIRILFDQVPASIIQHNNDIIWLVVPSLNVEKATLEIEENGTSIFEFDLQFEYLKPVINSTSPSIWNDFDTITINGDNFSLNENFNILEINNIEIEILEHSRTGIKFVAPILVSNRTVDLRLKSSAEELRLDNIAYNDPIITEIIPNIITSFNDTIKIKGLNFSDLGFNGLEIKVSPEIYLSNFEFFDNFSGNTRAFNLAGYYGNDYENLALRDQGEFVLYYDEIGGVKPTFDIDGLFEYVGEIPGESIDYPVGFKIGDSYYYGLGEGENYNKDFWKYDPSQNTWERLSDFIGEGRIEASSTVIGSDGYVAFGRQSSDNLYDDIYRYVSTTDSWEFVTNHPNGGLYNAGLYSEGNQLFAAAGKKSNEISDVFKYDIVNNAWSAEANFPESGPLEVSQNDQTILVLSRRKIYEYNNGGWGLITELNSSNYNKMSLAENDLFLAKYGEITKLNIGNLNLDSYEVPSILSDGISEGKNFIHNGFLYFFLSFENTIWKVELSKL